MAELTTAPQRTPLIGTDMFPFRRGDGVGLRKALLNDIREFILQGTNDPDDADVTVRVATVSTTDLATEFEAGMEQDDVVLAENDKVLAKDVDPLLGAGIYIIQASGPPIRDPDYDEDTELAGLRVYVSEGVNNAGTIWLCTNTAPFGVGIDDIVFILSGAGGLFHPGMIWGDLVFDMFNLPRLRNLVLHTSHFADATLIRSDEFDEPTDANIFTAKKTVEYIDDIFDEFIAYIPEALWMGGYPCAGHPNFPEAAAGQVWYASSGGTIGAKPIVFGDIIYCIASSPGGTYLEVWDHFTILPRNSLRRGGQINATGDPNFPEALQGQYFHIFGGDGNLGGGMPVVVGDIVFATDDVVTGDFATVGVSWSFLVNTSAGAGATAFVALTDVDLTTPAAGDLFYWNGTDVVNLGPGTNGQWLRYDIGTDSPFWDDFVIDISSWLDLLDFGDDWGATPFRGDGFWFALPPGPDGYVYTTHGPDANPTWEPPSGDNTIVVQLLVHNANDTAALVTGDGKGYFIIPPELNGMNLVGVFAGLVTSSSSGIPTFQLANVTQGADMLSTKLTVDAGENSSLNPAVAAVIDASNDDVATGDILRWDCDVAGTGTKGVLLTAEFRLP